MLGRAEGALNFFPCSELGLVIDCFVSWYAGMAGDPV